MSAPPETHCQHCGQRLPPPKAVETTYEMVPLSGPTSVFDGGDTWLTVQPYQDPATELARYLERRLGRKHFFVQGYSIGGGRGFHVRLQGYAASRRYRGQVLTVRLDHVMGDNGYHATPVALEGLVIVKPNTKVVN